MPSTTLYDWIFTRFLPQNLKCRSPKTHAQYGFAVKHFGEFLGRKATLADLNDESLSGFIGYLLGVRGQAEITANEEAGRIKTFWTWAAKKRVVDVFPTVARVPVPERLPRAWSPGELSRLFASCRQQQGSVAGIPAWRWWFTLHAWLWCSAERIEATLMLRVDHLRLDDAIAAVPACIRKGRRKAAVYSLWPDLVAMLREMLPPHGPERELVFPWPWDQVTFYNHYRRLLIRAGLPTDRDCKPHRMRVSHATHRHLAGGDATLALGHANPATTRKSYLDLTLIKAMDKEPPLFRPWD